MFPANMPGLGNIHTSGGPPNDTPVRFIRKDSTTGKFLVTRDGSSVTEVGEETLSVKNNLVGTRRPIPAVDWRQKEKK